MEIVKIIITGALTIFTGAYIGVVISERSFKVSEYTRQTLMIATLLLISFVFKHMDNSIVNYVKNNQELMNKKIVQALILNVKILTALSIFFYMSAIIENSYKLLLRRIRNVK